VVWCGVVWCGGRTTTFANIGDGIAHVVFPKNMLTDWLGKHGTGQYYFVNFPELSLTEWHPFSVTSGPGEASIELHIRALGDHTRKIVALAKQCREENRQVVPHLVWLWAAPRRRATPHALEQAEQQQLWAADSLRRRPDRVSASCTYNSFRCGCGATAHTATTSSTTGGTGC